MTTRVSTHLIVLLCALGGALIAAPTQAAEFYFGSVNHTVRVDDTFALGVFLNTEGDDINAFSGTLEIPDALKVEDVRFEDSLVNFWVNRPAISNQVNFAGAIPGGYTGTNALLFSVVVRAQQTGRAPIDIGEAEALLDDGLGTRAPVRSSPLIMTVLEPLTADEASAAGESTPVAWESPPDYDPPEPFTPEVARDPSLFDGQWFLAFLAHDKGSGVRHYEVIESSRAIDPDDPALVWTVRESLVVLRDQGLRSYLYVKAIDRAGNHRVAVVPPQNTPIATYAWYAISGILIVGLVTLGFVIRSRSRKSASSV